MARRAAKDALFDGFATIAKALGNGHRAELVDVLAQGERHVDELATQIGQSVANTSFHLQTLASCGLVTTRRIKTRVYYRLASDDVTELWSMLQRVGSTHNEHIAELAEAYLGNRDGLVEVRRDELASRLAAGEVIVVDVRPEDEYAAGHIAGAVSIPIEHLTERLEELPDDVDIVAYCRGHYCAFADDAVRTLINSGARALRLEDGFPEWNRDGLPVASSSPSETVLPAPSATSRPVPEQPYRR